MTFMLHNWYIALRHLRALWRQPWYIAITLVQPMVWLLLFGALFKKIVEIPGFEGGSYIQFLTPGVVIMSAIFSSGWSGMAMIDDLNRGVVDRFLVSPVHRESLIVGRLLQSAFVVVVQSVIIVVIGWIVGARYEHGVGGVALLIVMAAILGASFGALSNGLALLARREETVIAAMNFILLPMTFLSSAFMQQNLAPGWIQGVARFNPVNWAIQAGRAAVGAGTDWGLVGSHLGYLIAVVLVCTWLATRAFRSYQQSV